MATAHIERLIDGEVCSYSPELAARKSEFRVITHERAMMLEKKNGIRRQINAAKKSAAESEVIKVENDEALELQDIRDAEAAEAEAEIPQAPDTPEGVIPDPSDNEDPLDEINNMTEPELVNFAQTRYSEGLDITTTKADMLTAIRDLEEILTPAGG